VISAVVDTPSVDLSGNGSPGTPLQADVILAPGVTHPLLGIPLLNDLSVGPNGLRAQPDRQAGGFSAATPIGFLPTITTSVSGGGPGGTAPWGARFDYAITCTEPDRPQVFLGFVVHPALHVILEPGASVTYIFSAYKTPSHNNPPTSLSPWFALVVWHLENNGTGVIRYDTPFVLDGPNYGDTFGPGEPVGTFAWKGYQAWIATSGFTGASAVSAGIFGSGPSAWGVGLAI
jgi:hypothetical protein